LDDEETALGSLCEIELHVKPPILRRDCQRIAARPGIIGVYPPDEQPVVN
jgi:hypothetical protein